MLNPDSNESPNEIATQLARWVQKRDQLQAAGSDFSSLDQQIMPFKFKYIQSGAIYGANSAGMLRWFAELSPDEIAPLVAATPSESA